MIYIYSKIIFHLPRDSFNSYKGIFMKVLFCGDTLYSDEPKSDKTSRFKRFLTEKSIEINYNTL